MKHLFYGVLIAVCLFYAMSISHAEPIGELNKNVTQGNIKQTICVSGWTSTVRPSVSYTNNLKRSQLHSGDIMSDFEEDHYIPLELGGHPTDKNNLWPELWSGTCNAHDKDRTETRLKKNVCSGKMTLIEAQSAIHDWRNTYKSLFGKDC